MDRFVLKDTDFAVDRSESSVQVAPDGTVTIELWGAAEALDAQCDTSPFACAIHPSRLCLTAVPVTWTGDVATVRFDDSMADLYDIGLYLHEHGDIVGELTLDPARTLRIRGSAQVNGRAESMDVQVGLPMPPE
ncbi:hypothetical protein OH786_32340 [Streptomyces atratus]|uniref:Uncharacterized protein n=1 Tax=Streptomyces atratus TaxID=1893 RepID=A0A1K2F0L4_STRAR|nr:hypothetical protein [Streptomyces atratus]SFY40533.1 hypothetical protein SAMN02787144_102560 [Streptomyces atratus]